jgi:predicted methyltransferase
MIDTARTMSVLILSAMALAASCAAAQDTPALLDHALAGAHRSAASKARDAYRHPRETLLFFGLKPQHHVVEITPGGGWYTEVLAPVLRGRGRYYAAHYPDHDSAPQYYRSARAAFLEKLAQAPNIYGEVTVTSFDAPAHVAIAPAGSADLVLTFRNVHNWTQRGNDEASFRAFFDVLKPGGTLGVVEHRAREGTPLEDMKRTGYMTEDYVIRLAEKTGFKLAARSEINANARDTRDHPRGVWSLPPTLRGGDDDRARYLAIGESDRMTLRFVKPQ